MISMSDFASMIEKQMNTFFGDALFDDFIHKELIPLSHIREKDSQWSVEIDLPFVDKKNIDVKISLQHVTVRAKLRKTFCLSRGSRVTEFDYFKKVIPIPSGVNTKKISAQFKDGILKIMLSKTSTGKKISVE